MKRQEMEVKRELQMVIGSRNGNNNAPTAGTVSSLCMQRFVLCIVPWWSYYTGFYESCALPVVLCFVIRYSVWLTGAHVANNLAI